MTAYAESRFLSTRLWYRILSKDYTVRYGRGLEVPWIDSFFTLNNLHLLFIDFFTILYFFRIDFFLQWMFFYNRLILFTVNSLDNRFLSIDSFYNLLLQSHLFYNRLFTVTTSTINSLYNGFFTIDTFYYHILFTINNPFFPMEFS